MWKLNTSNQGKFEEFKRLFASHGIHLQATHIDLKEIDADPIKVIAHKASQLGEHVIVDDTSLDIEGGSFGVNIRWLLDHLSQYLGQKATWTVLLAYRLGQKIFIYKGTILGTIVSPKGANGFGFDPYFLPEGATQTLAECKPDHFNARAIAVDALINKNLYNRQPLIKEWDGNWQ